MEYSPAIFKRALLSGTVAGVGSALAASVAGRREVQAFAAPLNATSHIVWGDEAARQDRPSIKYTLTGFLLNHAAAITWAAVYEAWFASSPTGVRWPRSILRPLAGAAAVSAGAYVTDYYLVPKRLTPGFEKRVSGKALLAIFAVLALGMAAPSLLGVDE